MQGPVALLAKLLRCDPDRLRHDAYSQFSQSPATVALSLLPFRISLVDGCDQQWVSSQQIVIIEVFIADRQPINALPYQLFNCMLDQIRIAMISEAGGELFDDHPPRLDLSEQ